MNHIEHADAPVTPEKPVNAGLNPEESRAYAAALNQILTATNLEIIPFGAQNEPLRLSQCEGLEALRDSVRQNESLSHIIQPGGTGKTREGIAAAYAMHRLGNDSLYVVPSQQAVTDFAGKARSLCPDMDVGVVYQSEKRIGRLTFITYASLLRCMLGKSAEAEAQVFEEKEEPDVAHADKQKIVIDPGRYRLVIWDEAHKYLTVTAQRLLELFNRSINVGFTATPRYYEGKEVAIVFGRKIHELNLETAIERKEISDFRNILITTDVVTGLELVSPEQEESAQVAKAINVATRNNIFPGLYKDARITVSGKEYTLLGEPTLAFCASIEHVHDLAKRFNDTLLPALKEDEEFRSILRAKGIDPDAVEQIAAPIHTGSSGEHAGMSLQERNALVERYHARKILVLVSTSVLQQSFDSQMTSVVIDTVPRQTYVGVGQAGMRALRFLPGKEIAFLINTQDADHRSLTFLDFQARRGAEEGIAIELAHAAGQVSQSAPSSEKEKVIGKKNQTSAYKLTYGMELMDLSQKRFSVEHMYYMPETSSMHFHFNSAGFQRLNRLILDIAGGDKEAVFAFIDLLQIWIGRITRHVGFQEFGDESFEEAVVEKLDDIAFEALMDLVEKVQSGAIETWSRFSARFQQDFRRFCRVAKRDEVPSIDIHLHEPIENEHMQGTLDEDDAFSSTEPLFIDLHETIPSSDSTGVEFAENAELRGKMYKVLRSLSYREREILKLRYGLEDGYSYTLEEVAHIFKVTRDRIRQIEAKAIRKLQMPSRTSELSGFFADKTNKGYALLPEPQSLPKREKGVLDEAYVEQGKKNREIIVDLLSPLIAAKKTIFDVLRGNDEEIPLWILNELGAISPDLEAVCSVERTYSDALMATVFDQHVLARFKQKLIGLRVSDRDRAAVDEAIHRLQTCMLRFQDMGGKSLREM